MLKWKVALTTIFTVLLLMILFTDVKVYGDWTSVANNSFESRDVSPGMGVFACPPWQTDSNSQGWRDLRGDVNGDGKVDIRDLAMVSAAFGSYPGHPQWNAACDLNGDGKVDVVDLSMATADYGKIANRKEGYYSWYANGGSNDYFMWQWLSSNDVMALIGQNYVTFSFYFYPQTASNNGSINNARAEIYCLHGPNLDPWVVYGQWVQPTSLQWYQAYVVAGTQTQYPLPSDTRYIAVIIHGKPNFKAWVDLASITPVEYTAPPYSNIQTDPQGGVYPNIMTYTWYLWAAPVAQVSVCGDNSNGMTLCYSFDSEDNGFPKIAEVDFNTNPAPGNSPWLTVSQGSFTIGAYWDIRGYLGSSGSAVRINLLLYYQSSPGQPWEYVTYYSFGFDWMTIQNSVIRWYGSPTFTISSLPRGPGNYAVAARAYTSACGGASKADFLYNDAQGEYFMFILQTKIG